MNGCVTEAAFVAREGGKEGGRKGGREGGKEGVIIQPISRQTDSNIEPAKRKEWQEWSEKGRECEGRTDGVIPWFLLRIPKCRNISHRSKI